MKKKHFKRGFIYRVRNVRTGREYVGQQSRLYSKGLEPEEIMGKLYFSSNAGLAEEWKAHPEDFVWEVVEKNITDKRDLDFMEAQLIFDLWVRKVNCYNRIINLTLAKRKEDETKEENR